MGGISAFGKTVGSSDISKILGSSAIDAHDSPQTPKSYPSNKLANLYAQLLSISQATLAEDTDDRRRDILEQHVAFLNFAVRDILKASSAEGAPVPNIPIPPPQPPPIPMGGPPGPQTGMPPAAGPAQNPGAPVPPMSPGQPTQ